MSPPARVPATLLIPVGAMALGVLLGAVVARATADVRSGASPDLDGIGERLAAIQRALDDDRRFVRDAVVRLEATSEPSVRSVLPGQVAEAPETPTDSGRMHLLEVRHELTALRERFESLDRERTVAEIAAFQLELGLPRPEGTAISLADLRIMTPAQRSAALRWRSFEDVQRTLGPPARIHPQGTKLLWEYDHPEGGLLGMRFANGRVEDAWN